ncbi:MAG: methylated-DNA--[protein]-cysteine S-methyltransferase [Gemmatimonadetes bacterium]|nr:methylated-DNA--[protein]-cysteine S-methyltransferase [Gemmatimonadota bacterium]
MTSVARYHLFDTPIGICAIAWSDASVCGVSLPELTPDATRTRIIRRHPGAVESPPNESIAQAIEAVVLLLTGARPDLANIVLDESGIPEFNRRVYAIARTIPVGQTLTYGDIARQLGDLLLSRQVGQALGRNPIPIIVPCHRVLGANGRMVGFSAPGGTDTKRRMLLIERALPDEPLDLFE